MIASSILKKTLTGKIADCLNGDKGGLIKLLDFYHKYESQLDSAHQNFFEGVERSLHDDTPFANMFLRVGRETSRSYRKKLITNLIYNHFIAGKAKRNELSDSENIVPGFIVVSPTMRCNLNCKGCYSGLYSKDNELTEKELDNLFSEVRDMGIHFVVISGGEPYILKDCLLRLFRKYDDMFFLTYTNGTLIDESVAAELGKLGNVAPAISVEGWREETERRRGEGMWDNILSTMSRLRKNGVLFGISMTATKYNMEEVTSEEFLEYFMNRGAIFGWYFMFMPVGKDPDLDLVMTPKQRFRCGQRVDALREKFPMFLADFWNDGEAVGGCLAAGRRYLHILHNGNVEPCVFAHFGVDNIREKPLREIVNSPFFKEIRSKFPYNENGNLKRPCMIIDNPKVLRDAVHKHNAVSGHSSPDSLLNDPSIIKWVDEYARKFAEITDPIWEEKINDPNNRWYKQGEEYKELFNEQKSEEKLDAVRN